MSRRLLRSAMAVLLLALVLSSCQFVQNEFFFVDRAAPPPASPDGTQPGW